MPDSISKSLRGNASQFFVAGELCRRGLGSRVLEVVSRHDGDTYRAVYTVRFKVAVYVLHVFQKKAKRGAETPKHDIDLIKSRLKVAEQHYKETYEGG